MNIEAGQGLYLQIPFYGDGEASSGARTFLVISVTENTVAVLNVSSTAGKEAKLVRPSNKEIKLFEPPFKRPSFAKLDVVYRIEYFTELTKTVLHNGAKLDPIEFKEILIELNRYQRQKTQQCKFTASEIVNCNKRLAKSITS